MPPQPGRIAGLDGVRALCALLVFVEHFLLSGYDLGGLGVKVFFALSGFLIVGILHGQRKRVDAGLSTRNRELRSFWLSRSLRIFPVYFLVLSIALVVAITKGKGVTADGLPYFFVFLGNVYIQHIAGAWGGNLSHLWSISIEQHFYMLASPLLLWTSASRHRWIVLALLGISVITAVIDFANYDSVPKPYLSDLPYFAFMAVGALLALARRAGRAVATSGVLALIFVGGIALFACSGSQAATSAASSGALKGLRELASLMMCYAVLAYVPHAQEGWLVRALDIHALRYLGTISYGFYVYHLFLPNLGNQAGRFPWLPHAYELLIGAQFLMTCAVSAISWEFFERRVLALKHQRGRSVGETSSAETAVPNLVGSR